LFQSVRATGLALRGFEDDVIAEKERTSRARELIESTAQSSSIKANAAGGLFVSSFLAPIAEREPPAWDFGAGGMSCGSRDDKARDEGRVRLGELSNANEVDVAGWKDEGVDCWERGAKEEMWSFPVLCGTSKSTRTPRWLSCWFSLSIIGVVEMDASRDLNQVGRKK
jgi:hypothetical protein